MTRHFNSASKKQLREYQKQSAIAQRAKNAPKYETAVKIFEQGGILAVMEYFNYTRSGAYRLVQKGKNGLGR